jgi:hypothetical protein
LVLSVTGFLPDIPKKGDTPMTVINAFAFEEHQRRLLDLAGALGAVSKLVARLDDDCDSDVQEWLSGNIIAIMNILGCLEFSSNKMAGDAEGWELWARKENIKICC